MNLNINGKGPEKDEEIRHCHKPTPMMVLNEVSHLMINRIQRSHDELFVQRSIRLLIMELARRDGRTQLELVRATHLKAPTVSVAMQKLEKEGIVTRRPDEYDLRATRVFLTEKGRELDDQTRRSIHESEEFAMSKLDEKEREEFLQLLCKIRETLLADKEQMQGQQQMRTEDGDSF